MRPSTDKPTDVTPLLGEIIETLGADLAARLLGAQPEPRLIVDLHDVLTRILRIYSREVATMWMVGSEPLLGGARPIDVLMMKGAEAVIRAIDGIAQGAHA